MFLYYACLPWRFCVRLCSGVHIFAQMLLFVYACSSACRYGRIANVLNRNEYLLNISNIIRGRTFTFFVVRYLDTESWLSFLIQARHSPRAQRIAPSTIRNMLTIRGLPFKIALCASREKTYPNVARKKHMRDSFVAPAEWSY